MVSELVRRCQVRMDQGKSGPRTLPGRISLIIRGREESVQGMEEQPVRQQDRKGV